MLIKLAKHASKQNRYHTPYETGIKIHTTDIIIVATPMCRKFNRNSKGICGTPGYTKKNKF